MRKEIEEMAKSRVIDKVTDANADFGYFDMVRTFKESKQAALDAVSLSLKTKE